jgi:hypothetical protein
MWILKYSAGPRLAPPSSIDLVNHKFWGTSIFPVIQAAFYIGRNLKTFTSLFETRVDSIIPILDDEIVVIEILLYLGVRWFHDSEYC